MYENNSGIILFLEVQLGMRRINGFNNVFTNKTGKVNNNHLN